MNAALAQRELINVTLTNLFANLETKGNNVQAAVVMLKKLPKQVTTITQLKPLDSQVSGYDFNFKAKDTDANTSNMGVSENDIFVLTGIRLGIKRIPVTVTTGTVSAINWGNAHPALPYVDDNLHLNASERVSLRTIFNGKLNGIVGSDEIFPRMNTEQLRRVPNQQYFAQATVNRGFQAEFGQLDPMLSQGYTPLTPAIVLNGAKSHNFSLSLLSGIKTAIEGNLDAAGAESLHRNYVELSFTGILIKGAAETAKAFDSVKA